MRDICEDDGLALAAAEGDREAFRSLVERHYPAIHRLAWRMLGGRAEADDLAQDVCVALPVKLRRYDRRARFTTWLHSVVVNAARDRLRRGDARRRAGAGWAEVEALRRAGDEARAREAAWLARALAALPFDLRAAALLVLQEEMSHAEAAEALGVAEGTVSWRMAEIRRRLRALPEEERP